MRGIFKKFPGRDSEYRLMFSEDPSQRFQEITIKGADNLLAFLKERLMQPAAAASRIVSELELTGSSFAERLRFDVAEVKQLIREAEAEAKLAEVEKRKAGTVIQREPGERANV